ncbi:MAG: LysR family transcriptional regulator, partial [Eubacterium callanderi]
MNSTQLECFMQVAENLNFARAAEALHITQPSVTHQIHTLEAELNVKLFHRTTRSVSLTQAGLSFFADAKNILSLMKISKMRLHDDSTDKLSFFAMGLHSKMELSFLPDIIK